MTSCAVFLLGIALAAAILSNAVLVQGSKMTFIHINDHHSNFDEFGVDLLNTSLPAGLITNVSTVRYYYGGAARISSQIKKWKAEAEAENTTAFVVHAGDALTGTLFYTIYGSEADAAYMNTIRFDAFTPGNHEFDDGDGELAELSTRLRTPVVSSNLRPGPLSPLKALDDKDKVQPFLIKEIKVGNKVVDKVGICGITTKVSTEQSSNPNPGTRLKDEARAARACAKLLRRGLGIKKVVLLTHIGYLPDLAKLANLSSAVDVIIGGHSHTLLGNATDFAKFGQTPLGPYPTLVGRTCIAQAWEYNKVVGKLDVFWNDTTGRIIGCNGTVAFPMNPKRFTRVQPSPSFDINNSDVDVLKDHILNTLGGGYITDPGEDQAVVDALLPFRNGVASFSAKVIATVTENICHTRGAGAFDPNCPAKVLQSAVGGGVCHIVGKSFLFNVPSADIAIQNAGGCRTSMFAGPFTIGNAYTILPFSNTLVTLVMTGEQIKQVLEDAASFFLDLGGGGGAYPFASGLRWDFNFQSANNTRFTNVQVNKRLAGGWSPLNLTATYKVVTNNFIATPRDGYLTFGKIDKADPTKYVDTFFVYAQSLVKYAEFLKTISDVPLSEYSTARLTLRNGTVYDLKTL